MPAMGNSYKIPAGTRVYAIGDIHGFADILADMHKMIDEDIAARPVAEAQIVYVGDYIDRGPDSKGVIDLLVGRELDAPLFRHVYLMGNHENAMIEFMKDPKGPRQDWLLWGGIEAIESYGITVDRSRPLSSEAELLAAQLRDALPVTHQEFLKNLKLSHKLGDYLFVHAGIQPGVKMSKQKKEDLIMIREPFLSTPDDHGFRVVHGHTINKTRGVDIKPNRINLDSGLYAGGPLSCAVLEGDSVRIIEAWRDI